MNNDYRSAMILAAIAQAQIAAAGMTAENMVRQSKGLSMAYDYDAFANELNYMNQRIEALRP
jgi:hypothetical protein